MKKAIITALAWAATACAGSEPRGEPNTIVIPQGADVVEVADSLYAGRVIDSPRLFRLYASITGNDRAIQAGVYEFIPGTPLQRVMDDLVKGRIASRNFVTPEGLMLRELADMMAAQLGIPRDSVLIAARDSQLIQRLGLTAQSLEGYLFPSTYQVRVGATAREIVRQMIAEFEARWKPEWTERASELGLSRHKVVTLASVIEAEVRYGPDRRYVSSVYHNRLASGMKLQADPTVIYALGRRRRLFEKDYQIPSPYNTYLIDGLPPGPICQPSEASLTAALYPADTDFLYIVARPDGKHVFSPTYREHLLATRQIRRQRLGG